MKKLLSLIMVVLMTVGISISMTACGEEDKDIVQSSLTKEDANSGNVSEGEPQKSEYDNSKENKSEEFVIKVETKYWRTAFLTNKGNMFLWGDDTMTNNSTHPVKVMSGVIDFDIGRDHQAAISSDYSLYVWGYNDYNQVGISEHHAAQREPFKIMDNVVDVALGYRCSAAVTKDGSLYVWGENDLETDRDDEGYFTHNRLGVASNGSSKEGEPVTNTPTKVMDNIRTIEFYGQTLAVIDNNGVLYTIGWCPGYSNGQREIAKEIMSNVKSVSVDWDTLAAVTESGDLYMYGSNYDYDYGDGTHIGKFDTPVMVMSNVKSVSLGEDITLVVTDNNELYVSGKNSEGNAGTGDANLVSKFTKISDNIQSASAGQYLSAAIDLNNNFYLWGRNVGHIDDTDTTVYYTPHLMEIDYGS